jgi:hypothetical protein
MKKISYTLTQTSERGLMHDSRLDSRKLIHVCNDLISLVNELVDEVNILKNQIKESK